MKGSGYKDNDDFLLNCSFIRSIEFDLSAKEARITFATRNSKESLNYYICALVLEGVAKFEVDQNAGDPEVPEFYRSTVVSISGGSNKLYHFGVDWGAKYCGWNIAAISHKIVLSSENASEKELQWIG